MNIKQAKEQIKNAIAAYFTKDKFGEYVIPIEKQRPIFLMGAPGIGKTAIMEQIATELNVGLVSYSMTHHTRQSALGLPFIVKKTYGGVEYDVSEYTMSEIIASVYDVIETAGVKEGILFLDEINCVSETLAPAMLQFLQYKVFGRHSVPKGWIVVTAGNPPEFNNSVREFDIVTWDRLKRVDVEADFSAWKEYAFNHNTHPAILSYLEVKKNDFYKIETTVDGKSFVTARGWSDLSDMMNLYEEKGIEVNLDLIQQYLQNKKIAGEFAIYYDLFKKYKSDYQIQDILDGKASQDIKDRAKKAKFDERFALLSLLLDGSIVKLKEVVLKEQYLLVAAKPLKELKSKIKSGGVSVVEVIENFCSEIKKQMQASAKAAKLSAAERKINSEAIVYLKNLVDQVKKNNGTEEESFALVRDTYNKDASSFSTECDKARGQLSNAFKFITEQFGENQELTVFITELTLNMDSATFVMTYGCDEYFKYSDKLHMSDRIKDINNTLKFLED
ncbi:MAG: AAA family ATPase [Clostridia bacterium]|nr:AAA family ATPase [Clostridia bacterium]